MRSNEELKEGMGAIMGGMVLKLRSEELLEEGMAKGRIAGMEEGRIAGKEEGIRLAKQVILLHGKGTPVDIIALEVGISKEEVEEILS